MNISVVGELTDIMAVNLQFLPAYCVSRPRICPAGLRGLRAARSKRIEKLVLSFCRMR
jgi:hypothetical protein